MSITKKISIGNNKNKSDIKIQAINQDFKETNKA